MSIIIRRYQKDLIHRYDDTGYLRYFSAGDFPGLRDEPFSFPSGNNTLSAHRYRYDGSDGATVVFCHGIGGGHRSYMKEIDCLCRRGYTVLAYDNTGCFDSEGASIGCAAQSLVDLDRFLSCQKETGAIPSGQSISVVGHSWGGFAAGNIASFREDIRNAVVLSGFISVRQLLADSLGGAKDPARKWVLNRLCAFERNAAPGYADACTPDAVNKGKTRFLFVHSTDDPTVPYAHHTGFLREHTNNPNAVFMIYDDRKHNPNYTTAAANELTDTFLRFNRALKEGRLKTLADKQRFFADADWDRLTTQDEAFWDQVRDFLNEA